MTHTIDAKSYGFHLTLQGALDASAAQRWLTHLEEALRLAPPRFNLLLDARRVTDLTPDAAPIVARAVQLLRSRGAWQADVAVELDALSELLSPLANLPSVEVPRLSRTPPGP